MFYHQILLHEYDIKSKQLPYALRKSVVLFDFNFRQYETAVEDNDSEASQMKAQLDQMSAEIANEIESYIEEQEAGEEEELRPTDTSKKGILSWLYEHGKLEVSKEELKAYGYPTGFTSNLTVFGEAVGEYRLKGQKGKDGIYDLLKD